MTDDLQPLHILLALAERQRDEALAEQFKLDAARRTAEAQAEQLVVYRREYEQRWSAQFARRGQIELVHCYQSFMERLTQAVDQQARRAELAAQQLAQALAALRAAEMRCASVRKLIERRVLEQRVATERRDQKQTDEAATRAAWVRIGATRPSPLM
jgi:flagellar FliJ protein